METRTTHPADELIEIARVLLLIQGAVAFVAMVEVAIVTAATAGSTLVSAVLTAAAAIGTLLLSAQIRRRSRRARRVAVVLQVLWLIGATIDLLLAVFLAKRGLELVPILTRIVLPTALFRLLRRPQVREAFGLGPTRRRRRRAARAEASAA